MCAARSLLLHARMKTSLAMLVAGLLAAGAWILLEPSVRTPSPSKSAATSAATASPAALPEGAPHTH